MSELKMLLVTSVLACNLVWAGPGLDQAEVRLPYGELKSLISEAARPVIKREPLTALLAARLRLSIAENKPVVDATFRSAAFSDGVVMIPLIGGNVSVASQKPPDARLPIRDGMLCQVMEKAGAQTVELRLLPSFGADGARLVLPPCPSSLFETGDLGAERSVAVKIDGHEQVVGSNQQFALPLAGGTLDIRMLGGEETREALRPPEPSVWSWQHQALVIPGDGEIVYQILARATASSGSGVSAVLGLPADAREVKITGEDLAGQKVIHGPDRSLGLQVAWKTRGMLDRELVIFYQLPRRPLDRGWKLQAPAGLGGDATRTRFIIAGSPQLSYAADGLAGPFPPKGLPGRFAQELNGTAYYQLESSDAADLAVTPLPVVATAEATISEAAWSVKVEMDGAMLVEGSMKLEYRGMSGVTLDVPPGMSLLSCEVGGHAVTPVNRGEGKLEINLPPAGETTRIDCSFTARTGELDPVEGTMELELPKTQLFIRTLAWRIEMPSGYQAETYGNLVRTAEPGDSPSRLNLRKNLCRDERPRTNVFYQRADIRN